MELWNKFSIAHNEPPPKHTHPMVCVLLSQIKLVSAENIQMFDLRRQNMELIFQDQSSCKSVQEPLE